VTKHPPGTYLLCAVELLERTSYYGVRTLLVLMMVAPISSGGLGWSEPDALAFYGAFTGAIWFSPLIGGLLIDRSLGLRRSVPIGGVCLLLGYVCVLAASLLPDHIYPAPDLSLRTVLGGTALSLGQWLQPRDLAPEIASAMHTIAVLFMGGLGLLVVGNGLFKPSVTLLVGELYKSDDPDRERAYLLFYMAIYVGVLIAGVVIGTTGERIGWPFGLAIAMTTMAGALAIYLMRMNRWLFVASPVIDGEDPTNDDGLSIRQAALFIGAHSVFAMIFWAAYEQSGGLMSLFILEQVDRHIASVEVPVTWFFSLTSVFAIMVAPFLPGALARWEARRRRLHISERFAIGLVMGGLAFAAMTVASAAQTGSVSILWPVGFYLLLTLGELMFSPAGFAMVGRVAPRSRRSLFMGLWLLSIALGSYFGGQIGALSTTVGRTQTFAGLFVAMIVGSFFMLMTGLVLRRAMAASARL
jgi:POT family proton-dependent oligopeptide transporter